jgi:hypothetical protein
VIEAAVFECWDLKALPEVANSNSILVVEVATQYLTKYDEQCWQRLTARMQDTHHIVLIDLITSRGQLIRQLWRRTFVWFYDTHGWSGVLNAPRYLGVLTLTLQYLRPNALPSYQKEWHCVAGELVRGREQARLTRIAALLDRDGDYSFIVEDSKP